MQHLRGEARKQAGSVGKLARVGGVCVHTCVVCTVFGCRAVLSLRFRSREVVGSACFLTPRPGCVFSTGNGCHTFRVNNEQWGDGGTAFHEQGGSLFLISRTALGGTFFPSVRLDIHEVLCRCCGSVPRNFHSFQVQNVSFGSCNLSAPSHPHPTLSSRLRTAPPTAGRRGAPASRAPRGR